MSAQPKPTLYELTEEMLRLRDLLEDAIDPETGEVNQDHPALVAFTETAFQTDEKIQNYVRFMKILEHHALDAEAEYKNLKALIEASRDAAKSAQARIDSLKYQVLRHMQNLGAKEIIAGPFNLKLKKNPPSVEVPESVNYFDWPDEWYRTEFKPDKKALLAAGNAGQELPEGVYIKQTERLEVK